MGTLDGKGALVTGGSRGIGRAIVKRLAGDGASVVFSYLSRQDAAQSVVDTRSRTPAGCCPST
ncbi:MAG: SDR family NAD(P)-dependent oxidoreductase [Streptosporangiaceae bacterium]|jgi:3-oxoacyl-[acyl-carrier protein] reductase